MNSNITLVCDPPSHCPVPLQSLLQALLSWSHAVSVGVYSSEAGGWSLVTCGVPQGQDIHPRPAQVMSRLNSALPARIEPAPGWRLVPCAEGHRVFVHCMEVSDGALALIALLCSAGFRDKSQKRLRSLCLPEADAAAAVTRDQLRYWRLIEDSPGPSPGPQNQLATASGPDPDPSQRYGTLDSHSSTNRARNLPRFPEIIGNGLSTRRLIHSVVKAAKTDVPVLISGESGTGKELVAKAIHRTSHRSEAPFIGENCGALPASLAESELFGHERGAFTGATASKPGIFEQSKGGTVFLDEIGEMEFSLQRNLLRIIQEKAVRRIGGIEPLQVDFRLISATHRTLDLMVEKGEFREDLYYRLNVLSIRVPALRDRQEDIPLLLEHFSQLIGRETGRGPIVFTEGALRVLQQYAWPGNIRQLRNEVWRLHAAERKKVAEVHLSPEVRKSGRSRRYLANGISPGSSSLHEIELSTVGAVMRQGIDEAGGNLTEAARRLGISRGALYRRMRRYGLST